ncbi:MAG: SLBB domain-containing protein [Bacteroidia bacterium]
MFIKNKFIFSLLFLFSAIIFNNSSLAQTSKNINMQNLASIKVDELTDEQIEEFWAKATEQGITLDVLELEATKRKMPKTELNKLLDRIKRTELQNTIELQDEVDINFKSKKETKKQKKDDEQDEFESLFDQLIAKPFGAELFTNKNISFEPNLKIATPLNYVLGPDDELIIDVFGYSEDTYKLKVSAEGTVRLPTAGPVLVSGLTLEQAKLKLTNRLKEVYSKISTGETGVNVTLGSIRSIKVIVLGEVNKPGTYTLSSLATVFNALYASGGPNENGSFRNIKIIRGNKVVATLDVYDFLMKGESKGNIRLQDNDIIQIPAYQNRVEAKGEVKRWALFETKANETLEDVLQYAGGFKTNAYTERIKVIRNTGKQKGVADVEKQNFKNFKVENGDVFIASKLLDRYENRVSISGAVFRPGVFGLTQGFTLKQLIEKADGLKEDAFLNRAIIYRLKPDNTKEIISVSLNDLLNGNTNDVILKREDKVIIASKLEMQDKKEVTINGLVQKAGNYDYAENMTVEDLIVAAGGFKEGASIKRIEVARRVYNADKLSKNAEAAVVAELDVNENLTLQTKSFTLLPFDIVTVYQQPGFVKQETITIDGEVLYPGVYTISKRSERISDIIKRGGGLTAQSFSDGAILLRKKQLTLTEQVISKNKLRALKKLSKDTVDRNTVIEEEIEREFDIVGIDLKRALKNPQSKFDLILKDGDIIRIPTERQTVAVSGEVLYPVRIIYERGKGLRRYVNGAGGFTNKALKRGTYVVYANGKAKATKNYVLFKVYPTLKPGSEIIVPVKEDARKVSASEIAGLASSFASLIVLTITVISINAK